MSFQRQMVIWLGMVKTVQKRNRMDYSVPEWVEAQYNIFRKLA